MNENSLRVLFISSWYPNRVKPLPGIFVKRHAAAVAEKCSIAVIYVCSDEKEGIEESNEDGIYTVRAYYRKVKLKMPGLAQLIKLSRYLSAWKKALAVYTRKAGKPDIISSNIVYPVSLMALRLARKWKIPYVITEHWTGYFPEDGRYKGFWLKMLTQRAVKHASAMVTVSEALKKRMTAVGLANQYYVIANVVDTKVFNLPAAQKQVQSFNFIHVSGLDEEQKNVQGIIRAFAVIHKQFPATLLTIAGNGEALQDLIKLCDSLQLKDAVHFAGEKTGAELVSIFQGADAFVLFSNYENLPCVMLEALCCGIPVIATSVGDVPLWINPSNGILINPHDEQQLRGAMEAMIKNRGKYSPAEIRGAVENKVNAQTVSKQFMDVYNKALNK